MTASISKTKTIIFLADGMADLPIPELDGRTPLEYARTPGMDRIAREGCCGELLTLPEAYSTGSEVANMSVLGCDLASEYSGRGPLEAAGRGIEMQPQDIAFRLNLISTREGRLTDYSAGHPPQADAETCMAAFNRHFNDPRIRFHAGVSYRNILILRDNDRSPRIRTEKPDDHQGDRVADFYPRAAVPEAESTARLLQRIICEAPAIIRDLAPESVSPSINGVWPWSGGRAGAIRSLHDKFGIRGAVISAVDVIMGLGRCLGMTPIMVPGATGYIDTNYEGKAAAAMQALQDHDFVYLHVEAIDEVSHARDLHLKIDTIEQFDRRIVQPMVEALDQSVQLAVLPDHPVPVALGKHTRDPVPVAVRRPGNRPDAVSVFAEPAVRQGSLGRMAGDGLMRLLFGPPRN